MKLQLGLITGLLVAALGVLALQPGSTSASNPGATLAPLLSCANVNASSDNRVTIADVVPVISAFFQDAGDPDYVFMYDLDANGQQRVTDIIMSLGQFGYTCPVVDTEVAEATVWILQDHPELRTENAAALQAAGYYRGTTDVPGQGIHYVNLDNWDGVFDPAAPEGLVYQNGKLAAQLYVTDGNVVGWGDYEATSCCPGAEHQIELETAADGPQCSPKCSWDGTYDAWHVHHYLCTVHIGTGGAVAIPGSFAPSIGGSDSSCHSFSGNEPMCSVPVTATPCYRWAANVGWMGHLWNWLPNPNQVPDNGGNNGRFADCTPDTEGWKSFNCPA